MARWRGTRTREARSVGCCEQHDRPAQRGWPRLSPGYTTGPRPRWLVRAGGQRGQSADRMAVRCVQVAAREEPSGMKNAVERWGSRRRRGGSGEELTLQDTVLAPVAVEFGGVGWKWRPPATTAQYCGDLMRMQGGDIGLRAGRQQAGARASTTHEGDLWLCLGGYVGLPAVYNRTIGV